MKFTTIYQRILPLWPSEIDISDGYEVDAGNEATPGTTPTGGKGYYFPTLDEAWGVVEDGVDPEVDTWGDMMVWTMFQEFHKCAIEMLSSGASTLKTGEIPVQVLDERYRNNLNSEGWESERDAYEGL
jgi:hypothetical protein